MRSLAAIFVTLGYSALFGQSNLSLPGCETLPEVRELLDAKVSGQTFLAMKYEERTALRRRTLEGLIEKHPREIEPYRRLIATSWDDMSQRRALIDRFNKQTQQHPDDPLALYLAGLALSGDDTTQSIRLLGRARSLAPDFPWPALELARIYAPGTKRADIKKSGEEIAAFFAVCPSNTDGLRLLTEVGGSDLQASVAAALRTRLAAETDSKRLKDYWTLWGLEFRSHPPQEHDALRKQVATDLERLVAMNLRPDAAWLVFLKDGYRQSGASAEVIRTMEDRIVKEFPQSHEAYDIVSNRWEKDHPRPDDQKDTAAWPKYHNEYKQALKDWKARFPEIRELNAWWFYAISGDPNISADEGLKGVDEYLAYAEAYQKPSIDSRFSAAAFLTSHNWQPGRALDLLRDSDKLLVEYWPSADNLTDEAEKVWAFQRLHMRELVTQNVLLAARLAEQPAEVERLKPFVEREPPAVSFEMSAYWWDRARLSSLEEKKAEALTYYQKALHARLAPPPFFEGRQTPDYLMDEARSLWNQLGGTETDWTVWNKPSAEEIHQIQEVNDNVWEKPKKALPPFHLTDLSGKTWTLTSLAGRAVLVNVWATWCGPCQAELPHLQKLYEKVKDRADLQILTLNIDEDPGLVAPFVKENNYTFPVLPAYAFVYGIDLVGIPQNWILDSRGEWRWTGGPDLTNREWESAVLKQLESASSAKSQE